MTPTHLIRFVAVISILGCASACLSKPVDQAARLTNTNPETARLVMVVLRQALATNTIVLGPEDLAQTTAISVLPPPLGPYETRSLSQPEIFDVVKRGRICLLVRRSTGIAYPISTVSCRAVTPTR